MKVIVALVVYVKRADAIDHRLKLALIFDFGGVGLLLRDGNGFGGFYDLVDSSRIKFRVIEVDTRENRAQNGFSLVQSLLKCFRCTGVQDCARRFEG